MCAEKYRLSSESVFTWRRISICSHPVCKDSEGVDSTGKMMRTLSPFGMTPTKEHVPGEPRQRGVNRSVSKLRSFWQRLRNFVVQDSQGGPYILLVHVLPDIVSGGMMRLPLMTHSTKHARPQRKGTPESRRAA